MNTWPIYSTILDVSLSMKQLDVHETPHVLTCLPQLWIHTILDARYLDNLRRFHFFSTVRRTVVFCRGGSAGAFSYMGVVSCCIKSIWTSLSFLMGFHYIDYVGKRWWYNDIWYKQPTFELGFSKHWDLPKAVAMFLWTMVGSPRDLGSFFCQTQTHMSGRKLDSRLSRSFGGSQVQNCRKQGFSKTPRPSFSPFKPPYTMVNIHCSIPLVGSIRLLVSKVPWLRMSTSGSGRYLEV